MSRVTPTEMMIHLLSQEVRNDEVTATGTLSGAAAAACYLARETHAPRAKILIYGSPEWPFETDLEPMFDLAQQGRMGLFFLSGAQIDRAANINLTVIGDFSRPTVRLPGGAGSAMLYLHSKRTALFLNHHSARSLVEQVDFITAPGGGPGPDRPGGPSRLITDLAAFDYHPQEGLRLASIHPWSSAGEVREKTGFELPNADDAPPSDLPDDERLGLIRGKIKELVAGPYPAFAAEL